VKAKSEIRGAQAAVYLRASSFPVLGMTWRRWRCVWSGAEAEVRLAVSRMKRCFPPSGLIYEHATSATSRAVMSYVAEVEGTWKAPDHQIYSSTTPLLSVQALAQSSLSPTTTFTTPPQVFVSPRFLGQSPILGQMLASPISSAIIIKTSRSR
jgi:hypothetical protein